VRPFGGKFHRDAAADALGGAGDNRDLALERKRRHADLLTVPARVILPHLGARIETSNGGPMKLDVLAIAAHPDDVELTCGGTMVKMARMGYRTGILDLTRGEMGTRGTAEIRQKEGAAAARILGASVRGNLGLPDAGVEITEENKLAVAAKIRAWQPHTVILPYWEGR